MFVSTICQIIFLLFACELRTGYGYNPRPYANALRARQSGGSASSLHVDLGYAVYQGNTNSTSGLNIWRGYGSNPCLHPMREC